MARFSVLLDACVLVPVTLADTLLRLAEADLYRPLWSTAILDEVHQAIEIIHPELADGRAHRRLDAMRGAFEDACVMDWEALVDAIVLPDPKDRHVVAAAQRGRADLIVTMNSKDFPEEQLQALALEVQHPDEFLLNQLDLDPEITIRTLKDQAAAGQNPTITVPSLLERLSRCGTPRFAEAAARQLWRAS